MTLNRNARCVLNLLYADGTPETIRLVGDSEKWDNRLVNARELGALTIWPAERAVGGLTIITMANVSRAELVAAPSA